MQPRASPPLPTPVPSSPLHPRPPTPPPGPPGQPLLTLYALCWSAALPDESSVMTGGSSLSVQCTPLTIHHNTPIWSQIRTPPSHSITHKKRGRCNLYPSAKPHRPGNGWVTLSRGHGRSHSVWVDQSQGWLRHKCCKTLATAVVLSVTLLQAVCHTLTCCTSC